MKIRNGFVSNSSSTSFVVAIPSGFVPPEQYIKALKELRTNGYLDNEFSANHKKFYDLKQFCKDNNWVIGESEGGPDNPSTLVNIFAPGKKFDRLKELIMDEISSAPET